MIKQRNDNGYISYRINGQLHRPNGPAIYHEDGIVASWWLHGNVHRYYGPKGASNKWYIHGKFIK